MIAGIRRQLEHRHKQSQIVGQEQASLWVSRNRSVEERNRLRALLGLRDFGLLHLSAQEVDFDWKGRVWFKGRQVLHHVSNEEPSDDAEVLMFLSARGDESGWWCSTTVISRITNLSAEAVRDGILGR